MGGFCDEAQRRNWVFLSLDWVVFMSSSSRCSILLAFLKFGSAHFSSSDVSPPLTQRDALPGKSQRPTLSLRPSWGCQVVSLAPQTGRAPSPTPRRSPPSKLQTVQQAPQPP